MKRVVCFFYSQAFSDSFYHSVTNTNKVERIQERALRFIYDDHSSSYEDLLSKSNLPSLKLRRIRFIALETFKILHKESPSF